MLTNSQLVALGTPQLHKENLRLLIDDPLGQRIFDNYDPADIAYDNEDGQEIARGLTALQTYMQAHPDEKVFLGGYHKLFDLALEGGGAFGFAHLGTLHAMALRGIWFDRVSGTSAGSIAAALIAGGYKVDLNYKTITDQPSARLEPSPHNSLNQILFDDRFSEFTDFEDRISRVPYIVLNENAFVYKIIEGCIHDAFDGLSDKISEFGDDLELVREDIQQTYLNIESNLINALLDFEVLGLKIGDLPVPGVPPTDVRTIVNGALDLEHLLSDILGDSIDKLIDDLTSNTGPVHDAVEAALNKLIDGLIDGLVKPFIELLILGDGTELNYVNYGLFRLLEFGGFWDGNHVRNWLERHLQELNVGTGELLDGTGGKPLIEQAGGPVNAVLFKDLKVDLCIVAADMGPLDGKPWTPEPVYFSKRTTPDYPVAEAVRRSISLPFVFIPRRINDGYGNNPPNVEMPLQIAQSASKPSLLSGTNSTQVHATKQVYRNERHHDHLLLDGGVFINLPVAVFRDPSNFVFDSKKETKPIIISNVNTTRNATRRPDDLPRVEWAEPIDSIVKLFHRMASPFSGGVGNGDPQGFVKIMKAVEFIKSFFLVEHQETEINSLLQLVPNSLFVDMHLRDPHAKNSSAAEFTSDGRIDAGDFNMSKTAKKWLVRNGFVGARAAFKRYEDEVPALRNMLVLPTSVDPYLHILEITSPTINGTSPATVAARCKQGDNPYTNGNFVVVPTYEMVLSGFQDPDALKLGIQHSNASRDYLGIGGTWIKMANNQANRTSAAASFLTFDTNLRTRVYLAIDGTPAFATAANGWERLSQTLVLTNNPSSLSSFRRLRVFTKQFERGAIVIPGPRNGASISNQFAYAVFVCPI